MTRVVVPVAAVAASALCDAVASCSGVVSTWARATRVQHEHAAHAGTRLPPRVGHARGRGGGRCATAALRSTRCTAARPPAHTTCRLRWSNRTQRRAHHARPRDARCASGHAPHRRPITSSCSVDSACVTMHRYASCVTSTRASMAARAGLRGAHTLRGSPSSPACATTHHHQAPAPLRVRSHGVRWCAARPRQAAGRPCLACESCCEASTGQCNAPLETPARAPRPPAHTRGERQP